MAVSAALTWQAMPGGGDRVGGRRAAGAMRMETSGARSGDATSTSSGNASSDSKVRP
jgi:hypothetical protein